MVKKVLFTIIGILIFPHISNAEINISDLIIGGHVSAATGWNGEYLSVDSKECIEFELCDKTAEISTIDGEASSIVKTTVKNLDTSGDPNIFFAEFNTVHGSAAYKNYTGSLSKGWGYWEYHAKFQALTPLEIYVDGITVIETEKDNDGYSPLAFVDFLINDRWMVGISNGEQYTGSWFLIQPGDTVEYHIFAGSYADASRVGVGVITGDAAGVKSTFYVSEPPYNFSVMIAFMLPFILSNKAKRWNTK